MVRSGLLLRVDSTNGCFRVQDSADEALPPHQRRRMTSLCYQHLISCISLPTAFGLPSYLIRILIAIAHIVCIIICSAFIIQPQEILL